MATASLSDLVNTQQPTSFGASGTNPIPTSNAVGGLDSINQGVETVMSAMNEIQGNVGGVDDYQQMSQAYKNGGMVTKYGKKMSASHCKVSTGEKKGKSNSNW